MKELEYLNLALNNIELIENIENCESLEKLDLTCNFIGMEQFLPSLYNLKKCPSLRQLYLTGNPCTDFEHHREMVIAVVPHLVVLDGVEIKPSERIQAKQQFLSLKKELKKKIEEEKQKSLKMTKEEKSKSYNREQRKKFYEEQKQEEQKNDPPKEEKKLSSKFLKSGEMRQCNEGKYEFKLLEYEDPKFTSFHIMLPRFMETSLIDVDILPFFISIRVKEKLVQIKLWEEVFTNPTKLQRSKLTGELYI